MDKVKAEDISYNEYFGRYEDHPSNEECVNSLSTKEDLRKVYEKYYVKRNWKNSKCFGSIDDLKGHGLELGFNFGCSTMWLMKRYKDIKLDGIDFQDRFLKVVDILREMYGDRIADYSIRDMQKIDKPDNYYDFVCSLSVWEHLTEEVYNNTLKECYRVLKPGGFIAVYVDGGENNHHHIRCVPLSQTVAEMQDAGFKRVHDYKFVK